MQRFTVGIDKRIGTLTLFIPDVRPEIIPMLPEQLGEKTDM